ncbi:hypothetical protein OK006_6998 [Actinobacteria bacterium OK006]|jgi:hypothetical protein|nr:hypothetical protein OK006_6998 [Actinobacteria bacterium OK006]
MRPAPITFATTADADDWLAEKQTEIRRGGSDETLRLGR